ncbi:MAG: hypothetical protein MUO23_03685 [Anaerolineales bacterium]|nr:hypothetical protein [Anaerolineales bacterium]
MPGAKVSSSSRRVDVVVVAAHYGPDRRLQWVQAYERRGRVWSDKFVLDRGALVDRLRSKKRVQSGAARAIPGDFELGPALKLIGRDGSPSIAVEGKTAGSDDLEVPVL